MSGKVDAILLVSGHATLEIKQLSATGRSSLRTNGVLNESALYRFMRPVEEAPALGAPEIHSA